MKPYKVFLLSALIVLIVAFILNLPIFLFRYSNVTRYYVEYEACREELKLLVEFVEDYRAKANPSRLDLASDYRLYDPDAGYLDIPKEIRDAIAVIRNDGFICKDAQWDSLRFHGSRIDFEIANGAYALVYSPEGRPEFAHSIGTEERIWVRHIEGDWYHVSVIR